jgi:CMP/dCMP kinase
MIITITGTPGSGKTSVAKELAKRLGYKFISTGDRMAKIAEENNTTLDELLSRGDQTDRLVDDYQKKLGETEDNIIVEGKIAWFLIPKSFKILVTCDENVGAERIYNDRMAGNRLDEPDYSSLDDAKKIIAARVTRFTNKFKRLYQVDNYIDPNNFDFVLDTTNAKGPDENADKIMAALGRISNV